MTFKLNNSLKTKNTSKNHKISLFKVSKNTLKNEIVEKNIKNSELVVKKKKCEKLIDLSTPWAENYGFPFHLSMKSYDTVLVKDIGISCALWKLEGKEKVSSDDSEDKLISPKQKKSNSSVTRKINAYTKSFFDILSMKITKTPSQTEKIENDDRFDKIPVATEYIDSEGRPVLKLRFKYVEKQPSGTSITQKKNKTKSKNFNKSKLKIFFLEMHTNNKRKTSLSSISSLFNNLTKSESSKKEIKITHENMDKNNVSSIDNNKITLPTNKIITTLNYSNKVKILHSPRQLYNYIE